METTRRALVGTEREQHSSEAARAPAVLAGERASLHFVKLRRSREPIATLCGLHPSLFRLSLGIGDGQLLDS
jgi:hypothetical protein